MNGLRGEHSALFAIFLAGCAAEASLADGASADGAVTDDELIGGAAAKSASYDAVGAFVHGDTSRPDAAPVFFCTGTLVAPDIVLTAKHCVTQDATGASTFLADTEHPIFFTVGPDASRPRRTIAVKSTKVAPVVDGGYADLGADVALVFLQEKITDIPPWKVDGSLISAAREGQRYTAIGYGIRDLHGAAGQRKIGRLTLQAAQGKPLPRLFKTFEDFQSYLRAQEGDAWVASQDARLRKFYNLQLLAPKPGDVTTLPAAPGYEAYLGYGTKDVQPCSGDSGGPLVTKVAGSNVVVGVVSASFKGPSSPCSTLGEVYATFGPTVATFLAASLK